VVLHIFHPISLTRLRPSCPNKPKGFNSNWRFVFSKGLECGSSSHLDKESRILNPRIGDEWTRTFLDLITTNKFSTFGRRETWNLSYLGIQLGGVLSTSQVANNFMGTGLKFDVTLEDSSPAILKLVPILVPDMAELEAAVEIEEPVCTGFEPGLTPPGFEPPPMPVADCEPPLLTGIVSEVAAEAPAGGGPGGRKPLLTALAMIFFF